MFAAMVLVDIQPASKLWGYLRFVIGRFTMTGIPGLRFFKVLGSGENGGFGLKPSATRQGLFCVFDTEPQADDFLHHSSVVAQYRRHAREFFCVKLVAYSSKGTWSGQTISADIAPPTSGPIAALTRASIRVSKVFEFWSKSPPAEAALANASGCLLAVGLGEAPLLRQATFSIWESVEAMDRYARTGAHLEAIQASRSGQHFSESMFVRFRPMASQGVWKGHVFG